MQINKHTESIFNDDDDAQNAKNTIEDYSFYVKNGRECAILKHLSRLHIKIKTIMKHAKCVITI